MTDATLFRAILAMDAYNRGYNPGIDLGESADASAVQIGEAKIFDTSVGPEAEAAGFYAVAYQLGAEFIISFRGTDAAGDVAAWGSSRECRRP